MTTGAANVRVSVSQLGLEARPGEAGRPQTNARVYLSLVGCDRLLREGWSEKQIRRAAFAQLRAMLGLPRTTVIAGHEHGFYMIKSKEIKTNLVVTVTPA
jgi:hypothetical protein